MLRNLAIFQHFLADTSINLSSMVVADVISVSVSSNVWTNFGENVRLGNRAQGPWCFCKQNK